VDENGDTFLANALLKANSASECTGLCSVADDSGLVVDALQGRPGVYSARFAGIDASDQANVGLLLTELEGVRVRSASFHCVIVLARTDGATKHFVGRVDGVIAESPRGANGFGYDPVFVPSSGDGRCFAEMTEAEKSQISHRGIATRALVEFLKDSQGQQWVRS
jgi:XTP/dITP diphosphohydrolase